jgi:hypothetical protein
VLKLEKSEILRRLGVDLPDADDEVSDEQVSWLNYYYHTWLRGSDPQRVQEQPKWMCDLFEIGQEIEATAHAEILEEQAKKNKK